MLKKIKSVVFKVVLSFYKVRWNTQGNFKVLIVVNDYFTIASWNDFLSGLNESELRNWDIVYCKNRYEIIKHFSSADLCFMYSYSAHLKPHNLKPKFLYFPLLGLEFLADKQVSPNFRIEKPPAYSAQAIAEYCIAMAIVFSRNLQFTFYQHKDKIWNQYPVLANSFSSVTARRIGILGVGNVGKVIADQFKKLGCYIAGCDKNKDNTLSCIDSWYKADELNEFLETIDILILSLPLNEETKYLIGKDELKSLGANSFLINISRGYIINEKDLIRALRNKMIKGAVLDTFSNEPLSSSSKLYSLDNLIISPHIAGNINMFVSEIQEDFTYKGLAYLKNV